jgi:hypothetical protein
MTRNFKDTIQLLDDHHGRLEGLLPTIETDAESLEKALSHFEFGQLSGPLRSVQGALDEALKLLKRLVTLNELRGELEALQALSLHHLAPPLPAAAAGPWKDVLRGLPERSAKIQTVNMRLSHILELTEGLPRSVTSEITNCQAEGLKMKLFVWLCPPDVVREHVARIAHRA